MTTGKKDNLQSNSSPLKCLIKIKISKNIHFGICSNNQPISKSFMTTCLQDCHYIYPQLNAPILKRI
jgi:hypothetical protein